MKDETYTCESCGKTYTKAVSDDEAMAEFASLWPDEPIDDAAIVCDDCFKAMTAAPKFLGEERISVSIPIEGDRYPTEEEMEWLRAEFKRRMGEAIQAKIAEESAALEHDLLYGDGIGEPVGILNAPKKQPKIRRRLLR